MDELTEFCPSCRQWYALGTEHICLDKTIAELREEIRKLAADAAGQQNECESWKAIAMRRNALIGALGQDIQKLQLGLERLRRTHHVCEGDCWYSCPKSGQCCNEEPKDKCDCGADEYNARIDALLAPDLPDVIFPREDGNGVISAHPDVIKHFQVTAARHGITVGHLVDEICDYTNPKDV